MVIVKLVEYQHQAIMVLILYYKYLMKVTQPESLTQIRVTINDQFGLSVDFIKNHKKVNGITNDKASNYFIKVFYNHYNFNYLLLIKGNLMSLNTSWSYTSSCTLTIHVIYLYITLNIIGSHYFFHKSYTMILICKSFDFVISYTNLSITTVP